MATLDCFSAKMGALRRSPARSAPGKPEFDAAAAG